MVSSNTQVSKFLSLILRHKPETIGLSLDANGWADIDTLVALASASDIGTTLDRELIIHVVDSSDKQRFVISDDGLRIRANQGHSVKVDLKLKPQTPPDVLYHGTATRFLDSIMQEGLKPGSRQHVHLSSDVETAKKVGQRHGKPVVLKIDAKRLHQQGQAFYLSKNGVWLTLKVPSQTINSC